MKMSVDENENKKEMKTCSVCGDLALGYNFNAVTCESCKAFFRRNAMKDKELRCPFKGSCEITSLTRRFCQKCRLDKCLGVGMKRELIMSEEDKERKRRRKNLESLPHQEQLVTSSLTKTSCDVSCQTEFPSCRCPCSILGCRLIPSSPAASPVGDVEMQSTPLSSEDKMILNELVSATKDLDAPLNHEMNNLPGIGDEYKFVSESLIDVINLTSIAIRRLIKMCKRVWGFRTLPQCDQLTLLKQGCTQMMLLRSVINFDPEKDVWKIPLSEDELSRIKVDILRKGTNNQSDTVVQVYRSWLRGFDSRASHDLRVICLLTAIALFDPTRPHLLNCETIQLTQERYCEILRRYLESLYRVSEAHEIYSNLIGKMSELAGINELYVRVYLNVDPSHVEPLLIEIFDLKSC